MRWLPLLLVLSGCLEAAVDRAADRCEAAVDEQVERQVALAAQVAAEAAWDACTTSYEDTLAQMKASFELGCGQYANGLLNDRMKLYGCVYDPSSPAGWRCAGTALCETP